MKLLLDQNLSQRLVPRLAGHFPDSRHVKDFGLTGDDDEAIWQFAAERGFILVSKDADFLHRSLLRGYPPKFVHLRAGNCTTAHITELPIVHVEHIEAFAADPAESVLFLG
jgi:predicted nuclease of predicted toxin-antitoxin system